MSETDLILKGLNFSPFFEPFSSEEKAQLARAAIVRTFEAGEQIFTIRHKDTYFFLVYSGALSLRLKSRKVKKYYAGEIFGEVSIFRNEYRSGNIKAIEDSTLIAFDINQVFDLTILPLETQFKLLKEITKKIIGYFYEDKSLPTRTIIQNGENHAVEFKKSLNAKNKKYKEQLVRTLSAFMNLSGGTLLIGVDDDGSIDGIEETNQEIDEFIRSLVDVITYRLGDEFFSLMEFDIDELDGKKILRIEVEKSMSPVFFQGKNEYEEFVIRTGTRNKSLTKTSEIVKYYQKHFTV